MSRVSPNGQIGRRPASCEMVARAPPSAEISGASLLWIVCRRGGVIADLCADAVPIAYLVDPDSHRGGAQPEDAPKGTALAAVASLDAKGRAPKAGYDRDLFGQAWFDADRNGRDTRNDMKRPRSSAAPMLGCGSRLKLG